ncbi:MAG: P-loop NTPase fold protein, partial [Phycisphaerales bacterium]
MRMLTDNPILHINNDKFGHDNYAKLISSSIRDTSDLPFCIGVFGQWGTGKTSLMRMIKEDLEECPRIKTIWFNPWKYDRQESLWSALIQTILYRISESEGRNDLRKKALNLAKATGWLVLKQSLSRLTAGIVTANNIEALKESISKQDELYYRHVNHFEEDFEEVINAYSSGGRLAVFIDDLDRCLPENAVTVLESLKLFIGNSRCVFILGMDPYVVEQGINSRYGATLKMSGRDYIDKMIQVPFFIPPVSFSKLKNCVSVAKTVEYTPPIWQILELGLDGNPRKIKRFVNCFYFLQEVVHHSE